MKKRILTGWLLGLCFAASGQQSTQYSQYMFNGIYINPAYAGYKEQLNLHAFYRSQWTGFPGAPQSFSVAIDAIANDGNVGLAFQLAGDKMGAQRNLGGYASYAYRIRTNADGSGRLALGLSIGIVQLGLDGSKLETVEPEPGMPTGLRTKIVPDARAGIYYSDDRFYVGASVDNLITQYIDMDRFFLPQSKLHSYLTAGMLLPLNEQMQLKPSFLLKDDLAGPTSLDLTLFLLFRDLIWVGGSYRTGVKLYKKDYFQPALTFRNAIVAAIELFPIEGLRVGYAYDISVGPLEGYSGSTHEISIGYMFKKKDVVVTSPRVF
ncbi:type IX secretion system membrane protein PorP/SprF [Chitinophaga sp. SYP-B3965]|uniref:PorP/SprF family type IX secretion system membrane protein n=1 Tax=Chitinophaga sp. SYP-B3965 TaxID=2663120 RepID=UPI0012998C88|nr:type IX secretion system membrane protein PorP/SprF [Chitinophaga sp. SYP-B3965]MRG45784.1 type IX secretion system membrane protein PorP/SprF [Chitinophaga sp. SYP-B3965]